MMSKSQANLMALALEEDLSTPNTSSKVDNSSIKIETPINSSLINKSNRNYKGDIYEYDVMKNPTNKLSIGTELGFAKKVEDQAIRLGITNNKYNWIAEKSLSANLELTSEWTENMTEDGFKFYFNNDTGESVWDHPGLVYFKDMYIRLNTEDLVEKQDPATPIKTAWNKNNNNNNSNLLDVGAVDVDSGSDSNSDSNSNSGDEKMITRKVTTELTDKFIKEDAMYWHSQYDSLLIEVRTVKIVHMDIGI